MSIKYAGLLLAIGAIGVCWSGMAGAQESEDRECFSIRSISSWSALNDQHLDIKGVGSANHFLLTMFTRCPGIRYAQVLAFSNHSSQLCSNSFGDVAYKDGGIPRKCRIDNIERVNSKDEAKDLAEAAANAKNDDPGNE
jgi:hypothetical protein